MSIFSVGVGGVNVAQAGILTASHNISNASTPGYSRQQIVQGSNIPLLTGVGFMGQGAHVQTVTRSYDQFLSRQVLSAETGSAEMDSYLAQIKQIDNLLADPSAGLSPVLADFFKGVQDVAANPESIPGRQSMLSAAQALVSRFQSLDQRMAEIREGVNSQIEGNVKSINTYATQIAEINQRIILAQAGSQVQQPNDLLDQREQMVRDLNKLVRVSTLIQGDGSFNVFIGSGQPLVVGTQAFELQAVAAPEDSERIAVASKGTGGPPVILPESQITGGALGGLVSFRAQTLDSAQNSLGRIALTLAQNFNDQSKLGMDLTGALGQNFFDISNAVPVARANALNNPVSTGAPVVTIDTAATNNVAMLTDSDYRINVVAGGYEVIRLSDNTLLTTPPVAMGSPLQVDGMLIDTATWSPAVNDSFLVQPTRTGARNIKVAFSDPRQIAAATPIRTATPLTNKGTASIDMGSISSTAGLPLAGPVTLTYDRATTQFVITGPVAAGPFAYVSGQAISFGGMTVTIRGNPEDGDQFTIGNNSNGVTDNRNALLLGALQTSRTMMASTNGPTASYESAYSQIVSAVGSKANEVEAVGAAQQGLADHAINAQQQISGVNLDEEAANLLRYQQAYQASAKILATATKVFEEILALGA